ncbi:uncharacterized protein LOC118439299 [Folsomia candida]|uniref:uncharacterized protein LOC118439299 n=1 Tax=Folsomia candida TaxID=158441 RepID=UPI001605394E|nr:uncharacterized protein LOC118439299 [Folsomia candida]
MATPLLRSRSQIHLEGSLHDDRSDAFLSTLIPTEPLPMASLTYNLHHTSAPSFLYERVSSFFSNFGHSLTSLTLQAYALQDPANSLGTSHFFSVMSQLVCRDCPSLIHLTLTHLQNLDYLDPEIESSLNFTSSSIRHLTISFEGNSLIRPRRSLNCMTVLKCLLAIAPNATILDTDCLCGGETFMYFLMTLRESQISSQLTSFSLSGGPLDKVAMNILNSMTFSRLTSLKMNTLITAQVQTEFIQFFQKLSPTLQKFVMFGDKSGKLGRMARYEDGFTMDFPLMPKLKVFQHQNYEGLQLGSEDFLQRLPNLEEVVIRDFQPSLAEMMFCPELTVWGPCSVRAFTRGGQLRRKILIMRTSMSRRWFSMSSSSPRMKIWARWRNC